jgi:predicted Zn-dependent peptidase
MARHSENGTDIRKQVLSNGLMVISEAMPQLRSVSIGVWVIGGSRFEERRLNGISHFIEHLLFKGTRSRSAGEIARAIDSVGGQLDAFTDKEYVGIYARVMDRHVPRAFEILADIVLHPTFPPAEINRERNVIAEEINTIEDSPQDLIHDIYHEGLWPDHPLGMPVAGTKESLGFIDRDEIVDFFRRHYSARNIVMTMAGNFRHGEVHELAGRHFGRLRSGTPVELGAPPRMRGARTIRSKDNLEQVHLCLGVFSPPWPPQERFAAHLLATILGGGMSSRLFQNIREKRGLVYSIESSLNLYRDAGTLVVSAAAAPKAAARVVRLILKEFRRLREDLVSAAELRRAKDFVEGSLMLGLESSGSRMTHLAQQQLYFGRLFSVQETIACLEKVTKSDIRRLANELFLSSSINLAALASDNDPHLALLDLKV